MDFEEEFKKYLKLFQKDLQMKNILEDLLNKKVLN
jgi:hypothetical protein